MGRWHWMEVLEPQSLRDELRELGMRLAERTETRGRVTRCAWRFSKGADDRPSS